MEGEWPSPCLPPCSPLHTSFPPPFRLKAVQKPHLPTYPSQMFSCLVPRPGSPEATPSKLGTLGAPGAVNVRAVVPTQHTNRALEPRAPPGPHAAQHARAFSRALVENAEYR